MKITDITDYEHLIHSAKLIKLNEHDYKLIVKLTSKMMIHYCNKSEIVIQQFEYRGLNRAVQVARIDLKLDTTYDWYIFKEADVLSIIFDNNMKTKLSDVVTSYENGELV